MNTDNVIIDALPYIDKEYDDPEMKRYVDNLIEEELKITVKKDTSELPQTIELFENDEILRNEMERIKNGEPFPLLDTIRYRLSDPQDHSKLNEWVEAVENSEAQLEHQYNRLINLELLNKFGANAWRYSNFQLELILNEITEKVNDKKNKIIDINKERKYLQTKSEAKIKQLEQQWKENVSKVLEIEAACKNLENEIQTAVVIQRGKRIKDDQGWIAMVDQINSSWKDTIRPLFQHYTERTPGSFIEEKEVNITWHYRNADPEFGSWQAAELQCNLEKILSHMALTVVLGKKTLELRPASVDKSTITKCILRDIRTGQHSLGDIDFILCIGDGKTDEPVFTMLNGYHTNECYTATVGKKQTEAKFYINTVDEVQSLLHDLISPTSTTAPSSAPATPAN